MKPVISYAEAKAPKPQSTRTEVRKVNPKRGGHLFPKNVNLPLRRFVRSLPCILMGLVNGDTGQVHKCLGPVVVCHLKTRGSGGLDENNVFPACQLGAHKEQEGRTKEFESRWQIRLRPLCHQITARFYTALAGRDF